MAAKKPTFGAPPAWVEVAPVPDAPVAPDLAIQTLLDDNQSRLGPDVDVYYNRRVRRIVKAEGLADFTSFSATWAPDDETLAIHGIKIIRDGKVIDLLRGGRNMLVLRREQDLESATLDGRMSASQQLEGLQVGDVVDISWTSSRKDPIAEGRSTDSEALNFAGAAARYRARVSWPDEAPYRWKAMTGFGDPKVSHHDGRTFIEVDLANAKAPKAPVAAPGRFRMLGFMETSSWASWADVSRTLWPHFDKAETADEAIRAEARAIAAANPDAKSRAFAALRLVEDKTRYFLIAMGAGGYVPASAPETWRRKFGDCKGKTVLLLTLLKELGIEAEPVLVNTSDDDGLDQLLPSLGRFNHVLVRATIDHRTYWLDGTRSGDESGLDALRPPDGVWALPLRRSGAELERIPPTPYAEPVLDATIRVDASQGLDKPSKASLQMRFVGDAAIGVRSALKVTPKEELERELRQQFSSSVGWTRTDGFTWRDDPEHNAVEVTISGETELVWRNNPDVGVREYRVAAGASQTPGGYPRREPGPNQDAPFAVPYPMFIRAWFDIVLPDGGKGFTVRGPNDEVMLGGLKVTRVSELKDGVARFGGDLIAVTSEISAAEAEAANKRIREAALDDTLIRAPR